MALIKHGNNALSSVTAFPSAVPTGKPVLLSTATASSSASIEFTSGIDSTYDIYKWEFINIHGSTNYRFEFVFSTDNGSSYNTINRTTTVFNAAHNEADTVTNLGYETTRDLAQSTNNQLLSNNQAYNDDDSLSGELYLFAPSSSTYVKHFLATTNYVENNVYTINLFAAGYENTTSPINAAKFVYTTGTFDGTIKMYGISA